MDDELRIEKIGILTLKVDPSMLDDPSRWLKIVPSEETLAKLKNCDRFEIEVVPFDLAKELDNATFLDDTPQSSE